MRFCVTRCDNEITKVTFLPCYPHRQSVPRCTHVSRRCCKQRRPKASSVARHKRMIAPRAYEISINLSISIISTSNFDFSMEESDSNPGPSQPGPASDNHLKHPAGYMKIAPRTSQAEESQEVQQVKPRWDADKNGGRYKQIDPDYILSNQMRRL